MIQNYRVVQDDIVFMEKEKFKDEQKRIEEQIPTYLNINLSTEPFIQVKMRNDKNYYGNYEST